jgi:hypothetical protein
MFTFARTPTSVHPETPPKILPLPIFTLPLMLEGLTLVLPETPPKIPPHPMFTYPLILAGPTLTEPESAQVNFPLISTLTPAFS